ncbi:MAG TPA: hypothetical protein VFY96_11250 [Candidatus Binatia bacterium]|jgi:hypothetical protein|nr:hypothetical protein [Candidatus Binatia bacterium]
MIQAKRGFQVIALSVAMAAAGCESVALLPRADVDQRDRAGTSDATIGRTERDRSRSSAEITGTVQRVDDSRREIMVRTRNEVVVVKYDPRTVVYDRDRELRVSDLRNGDQVSIQLGRDVGYDRYADVIRMSDRRSQTY